MADEKIIFSMNGVGKILPHTRKKKKKSVLQDLMNSWKAFSSSCWLWKLFPCKKLSRCLKK